MSERVDAGGTVITVTRGQSAVPALREAWGRLRADESGAGFWLHADWLEGVLQWLETGPERCHLFCISIAGEMAGMVPLRYEPGPGRWMAPLPCHVDVFDMITAPRADAAAILRALVVFLQKWRERPWTRLELGRVRCRGALGQALTGGLLSRTLVRRDGASAWFPLQGGQGPLAAASARFRRNLRRLQRRLDSRGTVELEIVTGIDELPAAFDEFLRLEAAGWKGPAGAGSAIVLQPVVTGFYRHLVQAWGRRGACRIHLMRLDGRAIAGQLALIHGGTLFILKMGYDEAYSDLAPGFMLLHRLLDEEWRRGRFQRLSLVTDPPWAVPWAPRREPLLQATVFNHTARAAVLAGWEGAKRLRRRLLGRDDTLVSSLGRFVQ